MHAYRPKSTPIAQGLVEDINAKHACGPHSVPIAQGLVYDINAPHAFGLRELKRTYGFVSTPITQGLVEIINAKDTKMLMSPKAQGLVRNTYHSKTCMVKHHTHERMSGGETTKQHNSGSVGKKTTSSDETNHPVVSLRDNVVYWKPNRKIINDRRLYLSSPRKNTRAGRAVGKGQSGQTLAPRSRRRRFRIRQITLLYQSSLRRKTPAGGIPLSYPSHFLRQLAFMQLNSTKT